MDFKTRDIPWDKVVSFHKEIASRAEESFFSLKVDDDSDRWSSLRNFGLNKMAGPWYLNNSSIINKVLERKIKQNDITEIFLGGPCWFKWSKGFNNKFDAKWQPLLYREVKITQRENGTFMVRPEQGKWEISPLLYNLIDFKGIVPIKPLDILIPEILEKAESILEYENINIQSSIIKVLTSYIPELADDLKREFPIKDNLEKPSDWVLFTAPSNFSAITQNLMADYNSLCSILDSNSNNVGGLNLLNDLLPHRNNLEVNEILPIIPLNINQTKAVEGVLADNPVTVISGPPGCGKSQVVLSVLLNAWANGKSVLFASNNNQAVDVIKTRLQKFESDFPIAVRAGAKRTSNLEETLRRTKNILSSNGSQYLDIKTLNNKQIELVDEKKQVEELINSKLPERIDQSIKSAINAYSVYIKCANDLETKEINLKNELKAIGYYDDIESFDEKIVKNFDNWINDLEVHKTEIKANESKHNVITVELNELINKRNGIYDKCNIESTNEVNQVWLNNDYQYNEFENWYNNFKAILSKPIENDLVDIQWKEELKLWSTVDDVINWREDVKTTKENIEIFYKENSNVIRTIKEVEVNLTARVNDLKSMDLPEIEDISLDKLELWLNEYKGLRIMPNKKLDFLPWSERNKKIKVISEIEKYLISKIPLKIWNEVGQLNDNTREKLSLYIESLYNWKRIHDKWQDYKNEVVILEDKFNQLNKVLNNSKIKPILKIINIEEESRVINEIEKLNNISEDAITLLKQKEKLENATSILISIANEFKGAAIGTPIREAWIREEGREFNDAITGLASYVEKEDIIYLRQYIFEGNIDNLLMTWRELIQNQKIIDEKKIALDSIVQSKDIISTWWVKGPKIKLLESMNYLEVIKSEDKILSILEECKKLSTKCLEYIEVVVPTDKKKINDELSWAREKVIDTINIIIDQNDKSRIENNILPIIKDNNKWPIDSILKEFDNYNLEKLKAKEEVLNCRIEEVSFEVAKLKRIEKLSNNVEIQDSLDSLLNHYLRNHGRINKTAHNLFKEALKAIPIWITTAQSPQAIPMEAELFDILVIDEATQCTLTNVLPLIYRCKSIAVIGDPHQLTAISTVSESAEVALSEKFNISQWLDIVGHANNNVYKSAVRCLPKRNSDIINLNEHYRSHPLIIGFSNLKIYQSNLKLRKNIDDSKENDNKMGIYGIKVNGYCEKGPRNESWINKKEALEVLGMIKLTRGDNKFHNMSIGVVTPFKAQAQLISELVDREGINGITIDTVHRYQGDERDIMIFSTVVSRGMSEGAVRWVENPPNLINVAVTRAKEVFYVVGDIDECIKQQGILGDLAKYVETITLLRNTSEYELRLYRLMILQGLAPEVHVNINDIEVDFVIKNNKKGIKIVIEVDGSQHKGAINEDASRDTFLKSRGYKVLRFSTREIDEIPAEVINTIINSFTDNTTISE